MTKESNLNSLEKSSPLPQLIVDARKKLGLESDGELSQYLGYSKGTVWTWREGKIPELDTIVHLATLGDNDPGQAVLDVLEYKAKTRMMLRTVDKLRKKLESIL